MLAEGILWLKRKTATRISDISERLKNYCDKVMKLPDSPKKIASGVALGIAFDFLPIPIISIPLSYLVARLIRCSPLAAVATVCVFKVLVPVFFTFNILIGRLLCGNVPGTEVTISGLSLFGPYLEKVIEYGYPFLVGSLVNAMLIYLVVYFLLFIFLNRRKRRTDT